ncbi:DUF2812 domain-containing protein [Niallia sp. Krafla_26]|uniref:DUF2812 domain-containing protein n=1 Tax=Niallia sp. Krafla_26 TaxID=3064703 RepID=UPI003D1799A9
MRKFKYFIDFEKEEKWLSDMAKQGYQLVNTSFGYKFRAVEPEETMIKVDYRKFKKQEDFIDYLTLFEDSGWKHVAGTKSSGTQYFKKMNKSHDDIFSDTISKAGRYKRLSNMFIELAILYFPILIALITTDIIDINALVNPKHLYLTPGLWEMNGYSFWFSFLFETPFALMRGFAWYFFPVLFLLYLVFGYKANKLYKDSMVNEL